MLVHSYLLVMEEKQKEEGVRCAPNEHPVKECKYQFLVPVN